MSLHILWRVPKLNFKKSAPFPSLHYSVAYSKWVIFLQTEDFDRSTVLNDEGLNIPYTDEMFAETLSVNFIAVFLIAIVIVMPILVLHPKFRNRSQRIVTVTNDRFGWLKCPKSTKSLKVSYPNSIAHTKQPAKHTKSKNYSKYKHG